MRSQKRELLQQKQFKPIPSFYISIKRWEKFKSRYYY